MARKAKLAPVVVETSAQDELSAAMAAMVSAPVVDGDVLVAAEVVVQTDAIVEISDDLGEFGPQIQADAEVGDIEYHGTIKQIRCFNRKHVNRRAIRVEGKDGWLKPTSYKVVREIWHSLDSYKDDSYAACPYYIVLHSDRSADYMLEKA